MKYANLHLHTTYSDGVLTPTKLCEIAKDMGYGAIAKSDHNNICGFEEFKEAATRLDLEYLLAFEGEGMYQNRNFHLVGYDFDPDDNAINQYLNERNENAYIKTKAKFDIFIDQGVFSGITWQDVLDNSPADAWFCNEHIFATLVKHGIFEQKDYWDFAVQFKKLKTNISSVKIYEAENVIKMIRNAGGVASMPHPHGITQYLPDLVKFGLNCVEYDHPDIDSYDSKQAYDFAKKNNIYLAGGTDHTGRLSNYPELRGNPPNFENSCFLVNLYDDVRCGATKEEFDMLKNRVLG